MSARSGDLEGMLRALATEIDYPQTPDLVASVRAGLTTSPQRRQSWIARRAPALAGAVAGLLVLVVVLVPPARRAVADLLGVSGIEIQVKRDVSDLPPPPDDVSLGEPVSLLEAQFKVPFELRVPSALGDPDGVFVTDFPQADLVTFAYGPTDDPDILLSQFMAEFELAFIDKQVAIGVPIEPVTIDGEPGYWIGGDHTLQFTSPEGDVYESSSRIAGKTLIWTSDGVTLRLEGDLTKAEALEIARSME